MIAVIGATGRVGSLVAQGIADRGLPGRAIVRRPHDGGPLAARIVDLADPASMRRALRGVERVFLLTPHGPQQEALEACALAACRATDVQHIVKLSGGPGTLGPNGQTPTAAAHWHSEQAIEASGLGFTFLRPSFFMQNLLETIAPLAGSLGIVPAPFGRAAIAMVDVRDVAACAAACLSDPEATAGAWSLTGPRAITLDAIGGRLGLPAVRVTPAMSTRALRRRGADDFELDHARRMAAYLAAGGDASVTDHVARLSGRPARSIEQFLDEHHASFAPTTVVARTLARRTSTSKEDR